MKNSVFLTLLPFKGNRCRLLRNAQRQLFILLCIFVQNACALKNNFFNVFQKTESKIKSEEEGNDHTVLSIKSNPIQFKTIKDVYRSSWKIQLADLRFQRYGKGKFLIVYGTSCSGKSSISKEIMRYYTSATHCSEDNAFLQAYFEIFKRIMFYETNLLTEFLQSENFFENFATAVDYRILRLKDSVNSEEQKRAQQAADTLWRRRNIILATFLNYTKVLHNLYDQCIHQSLNNRDTVIELAAVKDLLTYLQCKNFHCPINFVLAYCPLNQLSERIKNRNEQAKEMNDPLNQRYGVLPFIKFSEFYGLKVPTQSAIGSICREDITRIYQEHINRTFQYWQKNPDCIAATYEVTQQQMEAHKELWYSRMMEAIGFKENTQFIEITPKLPYTTLLNTSQKSTIQLVEEIKEYLLRDNNRSN